MKKITKQLLLTVLFIFAFIEINAQDGYTFTLIDNGNYNYSIAAVPNTSTNDFIPSVQSYGFTIIVPDGVTLNLTSSFGNGANETFFNGDDVSEPTIDGYLITETLGSLITLPAPSAGTSTPMVTIQINGSPTSGTVSILENNSALANAVTPLKSFMQADMIDDGMFLFANVVDPDGSAVSGTSSFDFALLSNDDFSLQNNAISLFPNPATDSVNIISNHNIDSVSVFNMLGKKMIELKQTNTVDTSQLSSGLYMFQITSANKTHTIKVAVN